MKKIKLLPLLAVGILALTGCNSAGQQISKGKAESLYDGIDYNDYGVSHIANRNGIDSAFYVDPDDEYYPVYVNNKKNSTVTDVAGDLKTSDVYSYLQYFHEGEGLDEKDVFFGFADINGEKLATLFKEDVTYTLEGKKLVTHFTGSADLEINGKRYGLAMFYEVNYDRNGFIKTAKFNLAVSTDYNADKNEAGTIMRFKGDLTVEVYKK